VVTGADLEVEVPQEVHPDEEPIESLVIVIEIEHVDLEVRRCHAEHRDLGHLERVALLFADGTVCILVGRMPSRASYPSSSTTSRISVVAAAENERPRAPRHSKKTGGRRNGFLDSPVKTVIRVDRPGRGKILPRDFSTRIAREELADLVNATYQPRW